MNTEHDWLLYACFLSIFMLGIAAGGIIVRVA
jgi:hypothetical protein